MVQIDHYTACCDSAANSTPDQFADRWPGHYLLVTIPGGNSEGWDIGLQTDVLSIDKLRAGIADTVPPSDDDEEAPPGTYLFEVRKHADNSWLEWIAIGRARNNDIILRNQSVSKLHARIHAQESEGEPEVFWLTDMRSTAGTIVNNVSLTPSQPHRLDPGDEIRFGRVTCEFLDPTGLFHRLAAVDW
jgi:hypothetical protein